MKRIYGIVGDSLNGLTDALRRQGKIEWVHVRHEEVAAFAAVFIQADGRQGRSRGRFAERPSRLLRLSKNLPHDWKEQRCFLGFAA